MHTHFLASIFLVRLG